MIDLYGYESCTMLVEDHQTFGVLELMILHTIIALESVINRAGFNTWGTIFNKSNQFICFADHVEIFATIFQVVAEFNTRLKCEA